MADVRVRKAVDLAIDRTALSQALAGGVGTRSLFPDYTPYFLADTDVHGDRAEAAALPVEGFSHVRAASQRDGRCFCCCVETRQHASADAHTTTRDSFDAGWRRRGGR